jgi:hypothetical protein
VQNFPFLARWCVLANVPQNCNDIWQRYNRAVCFSKCPKITVSCSKFSFLINRVSVGSTKIHTIIFSWGYTKTPFVVCQISFVSTSSILAIQFATNVNEPPPEQADFPPTPLSARYSSQSHFHEFWADPEPFRRRWPAGGGGSEAPEVVL